MKCVAVIPEGHPAVGSHVVDVDVLVDVDHKLAWYVNLSKMNARHLKH